MKASAAGVPASWQADGTNDEWEDQYSKFKYPSGGNLTGLVNTRGIANALVPQLASGTSGAQRQVALIARAGDLEFYQDQARNGTAKWANGGNDKVMIK